MFQFFRRYQKGFFIAITIVIVISFSFFGTFQAVQGRDVEDKVAFTAIDGTKVLTSELNDMIAFLSQDSNDMLMTRGAMQGNALNDGVVLKDLMQTGLAYDIARANIDELGEELQSRVEREKRYKTYQHPRAPFISASQVWNYYAPDIQKNLNKMGQVQDSKSMDALNARLNLFMAEREFPSAYLKHFLQNQETMHKWLSPDTNLPGYDLSLFGYHGVQDWFGRRFVELAAEFIINSAKFAASKGYEVTQEEVLGSLYRNCENVYRKNGIEVAYGIKNASDYFQDQLRHLYMDQGRVVNVWSQVLLFRRLFYDNADSILVSPASYEDFYKSLSEYVDIDLYQLPPSLRLASQQDLDKCMLYHNAVGKGQKLAASFTRPEVFLSTNEVKKTHPELVEKPFHVSWKGVNKEQLQTKVPIRAMWQWQVTDANWEQLKTQFPELAKETADTAQTRLALLDSIETAKRNMIDSFSRQKIVDEHPEWLKTALDDQQARDEVVFVRQEGGTLPFLGMKEHQALIALLETASLNSIDEALSSYSQDGVHYYQISVLNRETPEYVISYETAKKDGTLDALQKKTPKTYFDELNKELDQLVDKTKAQQPNLTDWKDKTKSRIAVYFLPYVLDIKKKIAQTPDEEIKLVHHTSDTPTVQMATTDGYKLVKSREKIVRKNGQLAVDPVEAFSLAVEMPSEIRCYRDNDFAFFNVVVKGYVPSSNSVRDKVLEQRAFLGNEAICQLGDFIVSDMKEKKAMSDEKPTAEKEQANTTNG